MHGIFRSGSWLILEYLPGIEQSRILYFQLCILAGALPLDHMGPGGSKHFMDHRCLWNAID